MSSHSHLVVKVPLLLVLLPLLLVLSLAPPTAHSIRVVRAGGTPYELGRAVGAATASAVHAYLNESSSVRNTLLPFYESRRDVYDALAKANSEAYPDVWDELQGMAEGAGVPLHVLALVAFGSEIDMIVKGGHALDNACTDVHYVGAAAGDRLLAHNEDSEALVGRLAFILEAAPQGKPPFVTYNYPAALPGNAFGANPYVAFSFNALFPANAPESGVARAFVNRDVLASTSVDDARRRALNPALASGFSMNVAAVGSGAGGAPTHYSVERAPNGLAAERAVVSGNWSHQNEYRMLACDTVTAAAPDAPVCAQYESVSSLHRLARINEMPPVRGRASALAVLGDHTDAQYPIYRDGAPPDPFFTVASAYFDLTAAVPFMDVWVGVNPASSPPTARFPVPSTNSSRAA